MLQSQLFAHTRREAPRDEESLNAKLLVRAGFVNKSSAGVYSYLPLGLRVLKKINDVVRGEMNALGAEEVLMPTLVKKEYWEKSGRWEVDVIYKVKSQKSKVKIEECDYGLGWTHEEVITTIFKDYISSYRDLPKSVYQIQTKFRHEARARGGLLRGREFLMKDLYSFHENKKDLDSFYQKVIDAYKKIFERLSLKTRVVEAGGGEFTKEFTHEFQVLHPSGEDVVFYCAKCEFAQNKDIYDRGPKTEDRCLKCGGEILESNAIEVGNVFRLGTRYSEKFDLTYRDADGKSRLVEMGSYGIGQSRLMGTLVEVHNDKNGIVWPEAVAPFVVHLIRLGDSKSVVGFAEKLYAHLLKKNIEVLYDDREISAGEKFSDADLIGIPWRVVVSEKTIAAGKVEVRHRSGGEAKMMSGEELLKFLISNY